jgi:hypothetical protein
MRMSRADASSAHRSEPAESDTRKIARESAIGRNVAASRLDFNHIDPGEPDSRHYAIVNFSFDSGRTSADDAGVRGGNADNHNAGYVKTASRDAGDHTGICGTCYVTCDDWTDNSNAGDGAAKRSPGYCAECAAEAGFIPGRIIKRTR